MALLDDDLGADGPVTQVAASQDGVEERALQLGREHGLRAMDAWHLAVAVVVGPTLLEVGESLGFATRDDEQARVAEQLGFVAL